MRVGLELLLILAISLAREGVCQPFVNYNVFVEIPFNFSFPFDLNVHLFIFSV